MKWVSETVDRFTSALRRFDGARSGSPQRHANRRLNCRLQRLEQLEERRLLSVGEIGDNQETFLLDPMEDVFSTDLSILDDSTRPAGGDGSVVVAGLDQGDLPLSMPSAETSSGPLRTSLAARLDVAPGVRLPLAVFPSNPQTVGTSFPGINLGDQFADFGSGSIPPDTMGAVGPNHFVEVINSSVAIYDKLGTRLSHVPLDSFFATGAFPHNGAFDPRVLFDRQSGRWFATAMETGAVSGEDNDVILAVSRTNDPTGGWDKYVIPVGEATSGRSFFTDYSTLGVDDNGVYFGMRIFPSSGGSFAKIAATAKASLLAATPSLSTVYQWSNITDMWSSPQPAYNFDSVGGSGRVWFVSSSTTVFGNVNYRTLTWSGGVPSLSGTSILSTPFYASNQNAPASGSTTNVNVGDDRLLMAVIRDNSLWTTRNVGVNGSGGSSAADRVGAEWLELDVSTATASLVQSGRVFDTAPNDPRFYYYPSLMVNGQGHMAMGFSGSNSTEFVGAYTTGRLATDTLGTTQAVTLLKAGEAPYTRNDSFGRNRWGDYSYTSLDPNDDMTIWTIQEYAVDQPSSNIWGTTVAQLRSEAPTLNNPGGSEPQGATGVSLSLVGTGFYDPGSGFPNRLGVELTGGAVNGISNYNVAFNSPTSATVTFDVAAGASTGFRNLVLTNPDGQFATVVNGFEVIGTDYGDAPAPYPTLAVDNGAAHLLVSNGPFMGPLVDPDPNGQPTLGADGDDNDGTDDEDGLNNPAGDLALVVGVAPSVDVTVTNNSGTAATLYGWIDYNGDGVFDNATERASIGVPTGTTAVTKTLTFPVVPSGSVADTYARFRLSTDTAAQNPTGLASNGEVEDYQATIAPEVTVAVLPAGVAEDGTSNLVYTFTRSGVTSGPLAVNFNVSGTALFSTDYTQTGAATFTATTGTVTIPAGNAAVTVTVDPTADSTVEADETVILTVAAGTGYNVGSPNSDTDTGTITDDDTAQVVARQIFYNNSKWDGNNAAANSGDDAAIAPGKQALLPGQTAAFVNYTSYKKGINAVMVDVDNLANAAALTDSDFTFNVGNDNAPAGWPAAPAPTSVTVRPGAGVGGSDRVTILWADNAIQKEWLMVRVKATANTGLAAEDVFLFGNAIAETGNLSANAIVNVADVLATRANQTGFGSATIENVYDFDRDGRVTTGDVITARVNQSGFTPLKLIDLTAFSGLSASIDRTASSSLPATAEPMDDGDPGREDIAVHDRAVLETVAGEQTDLKSLRWYAYDYEQMLAERSGGKTEKIHQQELVDFTMATDW